MCFLVFTVTVCISNLKQDDLIEMTKQYSGGILRS